MLTRTDKSMSITAVHHQDIRPGQKWALVLVGAGLLMLLIALFSGWPWHPAIFLPVMISLLTAGGIWFAIAQYKGLPAGIKNNGVMFSALTQRGVWAWLLAILITGFYVCLYWFPSALWGLIQFFNPISQCLRGNPADQWFVYGAFYTMAVLIMGFKFMIKFRHSRYQVIRTISVMFFQLIFSFLIPAILIMFNQPEFYFSYFWPLKPEYLFPATIQQLTRDAAHLGVFFISWGIVMSFIAVPVLTYFYGKRWYCSWVCGCGGLAETAGEPFRTLSDKSLRAWKIERWMVHGVLVFIVITTVILWLNSWQQGGILGAVSGPFAKTYGFLIGAVFSGVIGLGFYPLMGSRVWCRFGCPQAAILGIFQKYFSRFRITTNGGQCISCGNCSTYCEMGIDVKWYAQRGQDIVRASCVGCGMCSTVCPRGVLKLENIRRKDTWVNMDVK